MSTKSTFWERNDSEKGNLFCKRLRSKTNKYLITTYCSYFFGLNTCKTYIHTIANYRIGMKAFFKYEVVWIFVDIDAVISVDPVKHKLY